MTPEVVKDPCCGLELVNQDATDYSIFGGKVVYFCSDACKERFDIRASRQLQQIDRHGAILYTRPQS